MKSLLNKSLPLILCAILVYGCNSNISKIKKPRIAIAGLAIESSTFSPARSGVDAFLAREGKDVFKTEISLMKNVEKKWQKYAHHWMILHGRYVCKARKPECGKCDIVDLCEFKDKVF